MGKEEPHLAAMAVPGSVLAVRVTARAGRNAVTMEAEEIRVAVTAAPTEGKANEAVRRLLAEALGIAPSRLTLVRGAAARHKQFRID